MMAKKAPGWRVAWCTGHKVAILCTHTRTVSLVWCTHPRAYEQLFALQAESTQDSQPVPHLRADKAKIHLRAPLSMVENL